MIGIHSAIGLAGDDGGCEIVGLGAEIKCFCANFDFVVESVGATGVVEDEGVVRVWKYWVSMSRIERLDFRRAATQLTIYG